MDELEVGVIVFPKEFKVTAESVQRGRYEIGHCLIEVGSSGAMLDFPCFESRKSPLSTGLHGELSEMT